jgi:hypothetical protein
MANRDPVPHQPSTISHQPFPQWWQPEQLLLPQPPQPQDDELDPPELLCAKNPDISFLAPRCPHPGHSISSVAAFIAQSFSNLVTHFRHSNS